MKNLSAAYFLYVTVVGSTASCLVCATLLDASFKSMFVLVFALAICFAMVRNSAATRHLLLTTTMLSLTLMPMCALLLPEWRVLPAWILVENRIENTTMAAISPMESPPPTTLLRKLAEGAATVGSEAQLSVEAHTGQVSVEPAIVSGHSLQVPEPPNKAEFVAEPILVRLNALLILSVWATGFLIGLFPLIAAMVRLRRLEQTYQTGKKLDPKIARLVRSYSGMLGIRIPKVILGPESVMPMVWSFGSSRLLLPADAVKWTHSKLNAVLLHELIHLRRRDPAVCALAIVARALNWFNPLAWVAVKRLRAECEQACDDHVLRMGVEPSDYASHLLELSTHAKFALTVGPLAIAMASKPSVEKRIMAILSERKNRRGVSFPRVFATLIAGAFLAATLATVATRAATNKEFPKDLTSIAKLASNNAADDAQEIQEQVSDGNAGVQSKEVGAVDQANEATKPESPEAFKLGDESFEVLDLSLEQCIAYALKNIQVKQSLPRSQNQNPDSEPVADPKRSDVLRKDSPRANRKGGVEDALNEFDAQYTSFLKWNTAVPDTRIPETKTAHPLMWGRGTMVNRAPIVLVRINEDITVGQYEERIRNLVRDVEFAYWDLFAAYFNVDTAKTAVDGAGTAWKTANAKRSTSAKNAEAQARVTYHQFKAQLDAAIAGGGSQGNELGLYGREQNLRLLMGWAANDGRLIRPTDKPAIGLAEFDWETARSETLCRNIDLRQQKWNIKRRELELMSAKNQALPDVNLSLTYRWLGVGSSSIERHNGNAPSPTGSPSAFDELLGGSYQEGGVRLEHNPNAFGSRRPLKDVHSIQIALAREHRVLEAKEIAAVNKLSALWQQVDSLHKQMTQQFQAVDAAQTLVEVSQNKFDVGEPSNSDASIDNLLRAMQLRSNVGQNYIRALTEYNKSLVELHAIKGTLLEYNNIRFESASSHP